MEAACTPTEDDSVMPLSCPAAVTSLTAGWANARSTPEVITWMCLSWGVREMESIPSGPDQAQKMTWAEDCGVSWTVCVGIVMDRVHCSSDGLERFIR